MGVFLERGWVSGGIFEVSDCGESKASVGFVCWGGVQARGVQQDGLARRSLGVVSLRAGKEALPWGCFLCVVHALGSVRY